MSVQRKDKPTKPSVDGVTTPHLNTQVHGGKSTGQDAYRSAGFKRNKVDEIILWALQEEGTPKPICCRTFVITGWCNHWEAVDNYFNSLK